MPEPTAEEIAAQQAEEAKKAAETGKTAEEIAAEKVEAERVALEEKTKGEETVEITKFSRDAEGNFVWILDPADPKSTVYKGKTIDELVDNASKGIKEKDSYITKLKGQGLVATRPEVKKEEEATPDYPDRQRIIEGVFKEYHIDVQLANYSRDDWKRSEKG